MNSKRRIVGILCIVSWFSGTTQAHSRSRGYTLTEIAAAQSLYSQRIHSLQARFWAENVSASALRHAQRTSAVSQRMEVSYSCKGREYRWNEQPDGRGQNRGDTLFDGKSTYRVWYYRDPDTGPPRVEAATKTGRQVGTLPHVLSFGYQVEGMQTPWIGDLLQRNAFQLLGTEESAKFGSLCRVRGVSNDHEITFWFAPRYGFLAVRTEVRPRNGKGYGETYEIMELKRASDLWFAQRAVRKAFFFPAGDLDSRYVINVGDIALNSVPDSVFKLNLPAGHKIYDQDKDVLYTLGAAGEKTEDQTYTNSRRFSLALMKNWLFIASLTSLLVLCMRASIQWQQRRMSG